MNAKSSLFALVSIKPQGIRELIRRLPYSNHSIYHAVSELKNERLIVKTRRGNGWVLDVADGSRPQKMKEIYIQSLSHGVDPEKLLRSSTLCVWKALKKSHTLNEIKNEVDLSERWIKKLLKFLVDSELVLYQKRKPIIAVLNENNELNHFLKSLTEEVVESTYYSDSLPFNDIIQIPTKIERFLYEKIESNLTIKGTGFQIRGKDGKINILESVDEEPSLESIFLLKLLTPEGVEDICIRLVASNKMNYDFLFTLAKKKDMINIVGCYLDILNGIKRFVNNKLINNYRNNISKNKKKFIKSDKKYGKEEWVEKYEKKWNVDLYLDIGAIRHGVRAV
jgi:CTP-dependent riboflavin kinase